MKIIISIATFLLFSISTYSQDTLNSFLNTWNDTSVVDKIKLNAISDMCYEIRSNFPDSVKVLSETMREYANEKSMTEYEVIALFHQCGSFVRTGNNAKGLELCQLGLKLAEDVDFQYGIALSLGMIGKIYEIQGDYLMAVDYANQSLAAGALELNKRKDSKASLEITAFPLERQINSVTGILATTYQKMGSYIKSLEYFEVILKQNEDAEIQDAVARILNDIGLLYNSQGDSQKALEYFNRSLEIAEEIGDNFVISRNLGNLGNIKMDNGDYDSAQEYFYRSQKLSEDLGDQFLKGTTLLSLSQVHQRKGEYEKSLEYADQAFHIFNALGVKGVNPAIFWLRGEIYLEKKNYYEAINWCRKGLISSEELNSLSDQIGNCHCLYKSYKGLNQWKKGLELHERFTTLNDSLKLGETGKKLQRMEFSKQLLADSLVQEEEKLKVEMAHATEVNRKDKTRNVLMGSGLLVLLLAGGLWNRLSFTRKSKATLQLEKDRSEGLLLNILPAEVAEELKLNGEATAKDFDMVSIIFTDFKGFTETSEKLSAGELVNELNFCFKGFDMIMEKYGIEKIKTIGDAYMAAGGLNESEVDDAKNTVRAAMEMQEFIKRRKAEQDALGLPAFEMRAGVHTGPVVAGIVGVKKFQYDIWGDTVNTASRMESSGEVGQVNISQTTYDKIKEDLTFKFEKRSEIQVKGKGAMEMYFVT